MMRRYDLTISLLAAILFLFSSAIGLTAQAGSSNNKSSQWTLVWSDEFNSPQLDTSKWIYDIGGGKWGNQELEYYTDQSQSVSIKDGNLVITARQEKHTDTNKTIWNFTSGRIKTLGKFTQTYGRFEARIKIPFGQGIWPAFWMLGEDIDKVGWPDCGEIDIMENIGKEPAIVHGTIHGPGYSGAGGIGDLLPCRKVNDLPMTSISSRLNGNPRHSFLCRQQSLRNAHSCRFAARKEVGL